MKNKNDIDDYKLSEEEELLFDFAAQAHFDNLMEIFDSAHDDGAEIPDSGY